VRERLERAKGDDDALTPQGGIVGAGAAIKTMTRQIGVVASTDATVLILGETGTGKELVARAIHQMSTRKDRPFVTLNCAAIPHGLLESELFGYERGAFTGALSQKIGRFEMANQGTLFLDEVGDIPLDLQPKLLRALQEKSFERLGGTKTIPINVRLVAATNRNLTQMMRDKLFRSDLYYRLKVFPITTPPLRAHPEDIPALVRHFTKKYAAKMNRTIDNIPLETMKDLVSWSWPGNVRELENFIERSVILSPGSTLRAPMTELQAESATASVDATLAHMERQHIVRIVKEAGGSIGVAADRLGLPRTTLIVMMKKLGIS
jgi:transcriptional regulator with GAF, ATPase, and Fis domain